LRRRRAEQRVQRLEENVPGAHDRDAAHAEPYGRPAGPRGEGHDVAGLSLERSRELLVEHDLAGKE